MNVERTLFRTLATLVAPVAFVLCLTGCNVDSFFNPAVTGYWEPTATTLPVLSRIDAIESHDDRFTNTTDVSPDDLIPSDLTYHMAPGDFVTVGVFELFAPSEWTRVTRRIDAGGFLRIPEVGDVQAAGLTPQEFEDALRGILKNFVINPQVDIVVEEGSGLHYTIYGAVPGPGLYTLRQPNLRLLEALAVSGGVSPIIEKIYVVRKVELSEDVIPEYRRGDQTNGSSRQPDDSNPVDIEDLMDRLDRDERNSRPRNNSSGGAGRPGSAGGGGGGAGGDVMRQDGEPAIDIDDLDPVKVPQDPAVDIEDVRRGGQERVAPEGTGAWIYVEERGEWVRVPSDQVRRRGTSGGEARTGEAPMFAERVIEIPYEPLRQGESRYNIVIRPGDTIYVAPPMIGVVYVGGQIVRPGVYNLPTTGGLTLSRFIDAAGGLGALAIPERVDLVRMVGPDREATIMVNLGAIRQRTEPDFLLKPNDHIIIGTNWLATPLAIIRNGFRATYGFGFLLDRNFGNDVFGAPPTNRDQF